jgi:hypothetical protein
VGRVDGAPAVLRGLDELECHGQARRPRARSLGDLGPVPDRGEGGLDRVGGPQVDPVLGGVVVERQQLVKVIGDLRDGLRELRPVSTLECGGGVQGVAAVLGAPDPGEGLLRARVGGLGQRGENVRRFMKP